MKIIHKILGGIAAIILLVVMALNVNFSAKSNEFSDTFLANVEALARVESEFNKGYVHCVGTDVICLYSGDLRCCK